MTSVTEAKIAELLQQVERNDNCPCGAEHDQQGVSITTGELRMLLDSLAAAREEVALNADERTFLRAENLAVGQQMEAMVTLLGKIEKELTAEMKAGGGWAGLLKIVWQIDAALAAVGAQDGGNT